MTLRDETPRDDSELKLGDQSNASAGEEDAWVARARMAYEDSTSFVTANIRAQWERNLRHFQSRHSRQSKYNDPEQRHRSRLFRPKTRATVKKSEAACAEAFFTNPDAVNIEALDDNDPTQKASAAFWKQAMNYRLGNFGNRRGAIPWFLTIQAARQTADVMGIVISRQWWRYETRKMDRWEPITNPLSGEPLLDEDGDELERRVNEEQVLYDQPMVTLIPPENFRFDPGADWIDPIGTSPYLIEMIPMFVCDVKARMNMTDSKTGRPKWIKYDDERIRQARTERYNSIRQAREGYRTDSKDSAATVADYDIVWVHHNIMRKDGEDYVFDTLGTSWLLSQPKPLHEVEPDGMRPYVMGYSNIEAFKTYPEAAVALTEQLQVEANEVSNLRIDNVKLAMMSRTKVRRGRQVDLQALQRMAPGQPILMTDLEDVEFDRPPEVTRSSYEEQDRINADYDELAGAFSQGSVGTTRRLNETVTGMRMLRTEANTIGGYHLRTFVETWAEPVVRQLLSLEQRYETDLTVMALAGNKAQLIQRYGINALSDDLLEQELTVRINVGLGATDPIAKLEKFNVAVKTIGGIYGPEAAKFTNPQEVIAEVFGMVGYKDGMRFFNLGENPETMALHEQIKKLEDALNDRNADLEKDVEVARITAESRVRVAQINAQADIAEQQLENQADLALEATRAQASQSTEATKGAIDMQKERTKATSQMAIEGQKGRTQMALQDQQGRIDMQLEQVRGQQRLEQQKEANAVRKREQSSNKSSA